MSYAADTLLHYIKTLWEQTDLHWNSDNQAEVESIVESIESTMENQIKQKLQSTPASQTEQAKQEAKDSQDAVAMFAEHQKKQLRLSIATPLLAALISIDTASNEVDPEGGTAPNILVKLAVDYTDLLISEIQSKS